MQKYNCEQFYNYASKYGYPERIMEIDDYAVFVQFSKILESHSILDIGCGAGILMKILHEKRIRRIIGVDINPLNMRIASRYGQYIQEDAHDLNFLSEMFDRVICIKSFSLLDWRRIITPIHAILNQEGLLIIAEQEKGDWDLMINAIRQNILEEKLIDSTNDDYKELVGVPFCWKELLIVLKKSGFIIQEIHKLSVTSKYPSFESLVDRMTFYSPIAMLGYNHPDLIGKLKDIISRTLKELFNRKTEFNHSYKTLSAQKI